MTSLFGRNREQAPALLTGDDLVPDAALTRGDVDRFDHAAIAERVAELACSARAPVNVALFGPWGSGKSSVYQTLEKHIKLRDRDAAVVRYDAWKYGGQALKRNFIDTIAKDLHLSSDATTDLDSDQESSRVALGQWVWKNKWSLVLAVGLSIAFATLLWLSISVVAMNVQEIAYRKALTENLPRVGTFLAAALVSLLLGPKLFDAATTKIKRSAPQADDQFSRAFGALVDKATKRRRHRLVVFIDELDRCAPQDVVATLIDLKTFLEEPSCVFIVAADRDVLEKALREVPQSKPVREDEPYYSTPGAFLDKIFQHQMSLPPLRPQALVGFARDTVKDSGGLWAELREVDGLFEDVIFTLVPAHVRSPRRVKVLLNNYATNMRVAQARNIAYLDRATEIAKLTVLQTEFPAVAADLLSVPRLLSLIRDPDGEGQRDLSEAAARALGRYTDGGTPASATAPSNGVDSADAAVATDGAAGELLVDRTEFAAAARADRRLNAELVAYLRRTQAAGVPDPRPDLLYVQGAGAAEGLDDPALGEVIDFASETAPSDTAEHFRGKPTKDIVIAVRLMAGHSDAEFGPGQAFLIEAACRLVEQLEPSDVAQIAATIAPSVAVVADGRSAKAGMIPGGLAIAGHAKNEGLAERLTHLLETANDTQQSELLTRVLPTLPQLPAVATRRVITMLGNQYLGDPQPLHDALTHLDAPTALVIWDSAAAPVRDALEMLYAAENAATASAEPTTARAAPTAAVVATTAAEPEPATPRETAVQRYQQLLAAVDRRSDAVPELLSRVLLLGQSEQLGLDATVRQRAEDILPLLNPDARRPHAIAGLLRGSTADQAFWGYQYEPAGQPTQGASAAAQAVVARLADAPITIARQVPDILQRLAPDVRHQDATALTAAVTAALAALDWEDETLERRLLTYQACSHLDDALDDTIHSALADDLSNALTNFQHDRAFIQQIRTATAHLPPPAAQVLLQQLQARTPTARDAVGELRTLLAAAARCGAAAPPPADLTPAAGTPDATTIVSEWLALNPPLQRALIAFSEFGWPTEAAAGTYAAALSVGDRTSLWIAAFTADVGVRVLIAIAAPGVEAEVVALAREHVQQGQRQEQRTEAVRRLLTAPLHLPELQAPACDLALYLLNTEVSGDAVAAADIIIAARGAAFGYTEKLRKALQTAEDRNDKTLRRPVKDELFKLGLMKQPKKRSTLGRIFGS